MKIVKFLGNQQVETVEVEEPKIEKKDDVKIKIEYCGICGSDVGAYVYPPLVVPSKLARGEAPYAQGHEFTGTVVDMGEDVTHFKIGDRVTAEPLVYCGECEECLSGHYNLCQDISCIGYAADGAFAEYIIISERNVHHLPDNIDFKVGTLAEPTGVAYGAVIDSGLQPGQSCVVYGAGTIGIMAMQTAKTLGANPVIIVDVEDSRLELATEMGADYALNSKEMDVVSRIRELTNGGAHVIIEASGSQIALDNAIECARKHATIQVVAMYHGPVTISNQVSFMGKDLRMIMSSAAYNNRFDQLLSMISEGKLTPQKLISKEIVLDDLIEEGIKKLMVDKSLYKVLVKCSK